MIVTTNRRFDLDMRDRVKHVWDEEMGIPIISHVVLEAQGIDRSLLDNTEAIKRLIAHVCRHTRISPVGAPKIQTFPEYNGITALQVLRTSHLAIHTWPEAGYIHLEILTCSDHLESADVEQAVRSILEPFSVRLMRLRY